MRLSDDRISHIAHLVWDALYHEDLVDYPDDDKALKGIKTALMGYFSIDDEIDDFVRKKIQSLKRAVAEGSPEWEVLYSKYYQEEAQKRRF